MSEYSIAESPGRISRAEDYTIPFPCGCRVVYLGAHLHRLSHFRPCLGHSAAVKGIAAVKDDIARMGKQARERYELAELLQGPV